MSDEISLDINRCDTRIVKSKLPVVLIWTITLAAFVLINNWWLIGTVIAVFVLVSWGVISGHKQIRWAEQMKAEEPAYENMQFLRQYCWLCVIVPIIGPYVWSKGRKRIETLANELSEIHRTQLADGFVARRDVGSK